MVLNQYTVHLWKNDQYNNKHAIYGLFYYKYTCAVVYISESENQKSTIFDVTDLNILQ